MALSKDRNTAGLQGDLRILDVAAAQLVYAGALVMRNAAGNALKGATATGSVGVGRAEERVDNSAGSAGDKQVRVRVGTFHFKNSASGDAITKADIGAPCYVVDD